MNEKSRSRHTHRHRAPLQLESLETRTLLSIGQAGGVLARRPWLFHTGLSPAEAAKSALESSGRIYTPEARQRLVLRLARASALAGSRPAAALARQHVFWRMQGGGQGMPRLRPRVLARRLEPRAAPSAAAPRVALPQDSPTLARPTPENASLVVQAIIDQTNRSRAENGLPPVQPNAALMQAAQLHSQDMGRIDRMLHDIPGVPLARLTDRAASVRYDYRLLGENIAYNQASAADVVSSWMNSPPHRENMLNPAFTDIGVGLGWNGRGEPFYTMMLGRPA